MKSFLTIFTVSMLSLWAFAYFMTTPVGAADYTTKYDSKNPKTSRVLKNKREYGVPPEDQQNQTQTQNDETVTACTAEDKNALEEYDQIMVDYYQDSKFIQDNPDHFESSKTIELYQKRIDYYMDFIASEDFKKSKEIRKRCHSERPPDPLGLPFWLPYPHILYGDEKSEIPYEAVEQ